MDDRRGDDFVLDPANFTIRIDITSAVKWGYKGAQMFDFSLFLSHSGLYVALATVFLLFLVIYNPRLMLQDYPPAIQEIVPSKTDVEKCWSTLLGLPFLLVLLVFPIYATFAFQEQAGGEAGFLPLWLYAFGIAFAFNLWDWLVLDWLIFCTITPPMFVIPGSEGHPAYKDYFFHFRGFLVGTVFSAVMGLVAAGIVTIFG